MEKIGYALQNSKGLFYSFTASTRNSTPEFGKTIKIFDTEEEAKSADLKFAKGLKKNEITKIVPIYC